MYCHQCGSANPEGARYCTGCSTPLASTPHGGPRPDPINEDLTELALQPGTALLNRFRIERVIGLGGMGRVYLAQDQTLGRPAAIKVLREILSQDQGAVKRLVTEARASIELSHPNIVRVHDYHDAGAIKFLAMEFVDGETLKQRLDREDRLPEEEVRRIAVEACRGLEHAHAKKVVHRDLKPGNILLGKDGSVKIADFGIARICRDSMSRLTAAEDSGTLPYMSPEQIMGETSARSDIYSLGVVIYEMLSGDPPFFTGMVAEQIRNKAPKPLAGVSAGMSAIVMRCLEKKPEERFASARELGQELDGTAERRRGEAERRQEEERRAEEKRREKQEAVRRQERQAAQRREEEARQKQEECRRKAVPAEAPPGEPTTGTSSIGMEFVTIPAGSFMMGCSPGDDQCDGDESPRHEVTISRGIQMGKYEVTQGQWAKVMGSNPSRFKGDDRLPLEQVSWNDVQAFITKLNALNDGYRYRLPTEAEWEYAARAGTTGPHYGDLDAIGWYYENSGGKTHPVGQKQPNRFGLYDMIGNVEEWCADWYGNYSAGSSVDPKGPSSGQGRVLRGGSWGHGARYTRVSLRYRNVADYWSVNLGVRLCRERF